MSPARTEKKCQLGFLFHYEMESMPFFDSLDNYQRCRLIELVSHSLRANRVPAFHAMMDRPVWRPSVPLDAHNLHPLNDRMHASVAEAVAVYNAARFPLEFNTDVTRLARQFKAKAKRKVKAMHSGETEEETPPHTCVMHTIGDNGEVIVTYNYTLEPQELVVAAAAVADDHDHDSDADSDSDSAHMVDYNAFDYVDGIEEIDPDRQLVAVWQVTFGFVLEMPLQHVRDRRERGGAGMAAEAT